MRVAIASGRGGVGRGLVALALLGAGLARAQSLPAGFAVENVVLEPFASDPVAFAFLPDGRILLVEKDTGNVRLAAVNSTSSVVIHTVPDVAVAPERGLLGVAVDPNWPARPYLYVFYDRIDSVIPVTMYTASGDLADATSTNLALDSSFVLLEVPDLADNHNGGTLRFGPDGSLYVSLGDDSRPCDAPDRTLLRGKILRLDVAAMPDTGAGPPPKSALVPPGNPFPGPNENERLVWAYGLRNPFRFDIDPWTNDLYIGDVGFETWEEMDELVYAGHAGNNYGWPEYEGILQDPSPGATDCSTGPFVDPIYVYPNPPGGPVVSVVGGPLYRPNPASSRSFPRAYSGDVFFCEFFEKWMRRLERTPGGWALAAPVPGQPDATNWATNLGNVADLQVGPDGGLYILVMFATGGLARGLHRIVNTLPSDAGAAARGFLAAGAFPNPARAVTGTTIRYWLARPEFVTVRIFHPAGRLVRTLRSTPAAAGRAIWDGRNDGASPVAAGLYLFELESASGRRAQGKISLLR